MFRSFLRLTLDVGSSLRLLLLVVINFEGVVGNAEQLVHLLQADSLSLGHEEPDEEPHGGAEGSEKEEGSLVRFMSVLESPNQPHQGVLDVVSLT